MTAGAASSTLVALRWPAHLPSAFWGQVSARSVARSTGFSHCDKAPCRPHRALQGEPGRALAIPRYESRPWRRPPTRRRRVTTADGCRVGRIVPAVPEDWGPQLGCDQVRPDPCATGEPHGHSTGGPRTGGASPGKPGTPRRRGATHAAPQPSQGSALRGPGPRAAVGVAIGYAQPDRHLLEPMPDR